MRIADIDCFKVVIPIEAPILTAYGSLSLYTRTVVKLTTDTGLVAYTDLSARITAPMLQPYLAMLKGLSIWDTQVMAHRIKHWNYYAWIKPEPIIGALEIAMIDLQGKATGEPFYNMLGGKLRDAVPASCYCFYRHANADGHGEIANPDQVVAFVEDQVARYGFQAVKLKGGYYAPEMEVESLRALRARFGPDMRLRIDPQGAWTPATAMRVGAAVDEIGLEYYEDPVWGAAAMAQVAKSLRTPLATNMCVTQFEELAPAYAMGAVGVILADLWYWGGPRAALTLDRTCAAFGLDIGMHSGTEFGFGWAAMIHTAVAMPSLKSPIDYMNMHLLDDIIVGGKIVPKDGLVTPPEGPGLGVEVDEAKLARYRALAEDPSAVDRFLDPSKADFKRPGWSPRMPSW